MVPTAPIALGSTPQRSNCARASKNTRIRLFLLEKKKVHANVVMA